MRQFVVCGLGFGDEGKGTITEYLVRKYECDLVVRFNGGAQAAHTVVLADGRHHTFAQFGSGTLAGARTYLSWHVLVNPLSLVLEADALAKVGVADPLSLVSIDTKAPITTPYHTTANRMRELARPKRHGSCGMGIGETMEDIEKRNIALDVAVASTNLAESERVLTKILDEKVSRFGSEFAVAQTPRELALEYLSIFKHVKTVRSYQQLPLTALGNPLGVVYEGAQGALLDENYGFPPHQTYSSTTPRNAVAMAPTLRDMRVVGVLRSYHTRHGAGPLPTEWSHSVHEEHNGFHDYQGAFRTGAFDVPLAKYAIAATGVSELAITHLDHYPQSVCMAYEVPEECEPFEYREHSTRERQESLGQTLERAKPKYANLGAQDFFTSALSRILDKPINITSWGPQYEHKSER